MPTNQTFVDFATPVPADWLNNVNTKVNGNIQLNSALPIPNTFVFQANNAGATDVQNIQILREANYTGGTFGFVNSALRVQTDISANAGTFESGIASIINNSSTANNAENFAILGQAHKTGSSVVGTWAGVFEAHEDVPINNPATPTIGIELDMYANGTDSALNRVGLGIFANSHTPSGVANQVGYGISFVNNPTDTHPGSFVNGIGFGRLGSPTQFTFGLDFTYATFASGGGAINMTAGQFLNMATGRSFAYNGSALALQYITNGIPVFQILDNGNVQNTNNSYGAISDRRVKDNIIDAAPALDKLNQVQVREYDLKDTHMTGVISQELEMIFPELITEAEMDGKHYKGVNYMGFVPLALKAIQELKAEIDELKRLIKP